MYWCPVFILQVGWSWAFWFQRFSVTGDSEQKVTNNVRLVQPHRKIHHPVPVLHTDIKKKKKKNARDTSAASLGCCLFSFILHSPPRNLSVGCLATSRVRRLANSGRCRQRGHIEATHVRSPGNSRARLPGNASTLPGNPAQFLGNGRPN